MKCPNCGRDHGVGAAAGRCPVILGRKHDERAAEGAKELQRYRRTLEGKRLAAKNLAFVMGDNEAHDVASSAMAWHDRSVWMRVRFAWLALRQWASER